MEIGKINNLTVAQETQEGYIFIDSSNESALLPHAYVTNKINTGDEIDVFVQIDKDGELVVSLSKPYIQIGEYALLQAKEVNEFGAFIDWGLPNELLVPYTQQAEKMETGSWYVIFLLKDLQTGRLIGSSKLDRFFEFDNIEVEAGDEVELMLYNESDLGMNAIVNNLYKGLIFNSDIHKNISPGDKMKGYVKLVREDGKLDLNLEPIGYRQSIDGNSEVILDLLKANGGFLRLTDKSSPEDIKEQLGLSKKAFKRALGTLYKQKIVELQKDGVKLI
jgi:predicted RNA-binding protein (virulence factor B family)